MITPQQVYDYLQEKGTSLKGEFDPGKNAYKSALVKEYKVEFLDHMALLDRGSLIDGQADIKYGKIRICASDRNGLEGVVETFVHETAHADNERLQTWKRLSLKDRIISYLIPISSVLAQILAQTYIITHAKYIEDQRLMTAAALMLAPIAAVAYVKHMRRATARVTPIVEAETEQEVARILGEEFMERRKRMREGVEYGLIKTLMTMEDVLKNYGGKEFRKVFKWEGPIPEIKVYTSEERGSIKDLLV